MKAEEEKYLDIYYFYKNPCEICHEVENFSADVRESFGTAGAPFHYNITGYYVYGNEGSKKIEEVKKQFGISDQEISYPLVVAGENYLCGEAKVKNGTREMMEKAWEEDISKYECLLNMAFGVDFKLHAVNGTKGNVPTERDPDLPYGAGKTLWAHIYNRIRSRQGIFPVKEKAGTWEAFELALRQGSGILEMDVFRTTAGELFIPASNEPSSHACMDIWRLPRGSNTPLLAALQI